MNIERVIKPAFAVIGKEGSTDSGEGFIKRLWQDANLHFCEIEPLTVKDENGKPVGFWGAMTDFSRAFKPWENDFSRGLYLAGAECRADAVVPVAPDGESAWTKWIVPSYEYLRAKTDSPTVFPDMLLYLRESGIPLAGAAHDFTDPKTGASYMYFPVKRL